MIRSAALVALMASTALPAGEVQAQARGRPTPPAVVQNACPEGAYSVIRSPDGTSLSVLFHDFSAEAPQGGRAQTIRTTCRIAIPLIAPEGYSLGLTSVDYRGFASLAQRQSAELAVDYEVGRGNRAPRFSRRLQGRHEGDFTFTDRLPPGRLREAGCGGAALPVLAIDATITLQTGGVPAQAMVALDTLDQGAAGALRYRFAVRPCARPERLSQVNEITSE